VQVRIVAADGRVLPPGVPGAVGEVQVRGWRADGAWARTGDLGRLDATGRLFLAGRLDEMIVSGGENVYPGPLLATLRSHPAVDDALLTAVPDEEYGHRWKATICLLPGAAVTEGELRGWLRGRVTRAETPRDVEVVTALPRGITGKPQHNRPQP
jgi:acyl-CoA synthetase (AMP-forming)/AMP-acid ligase II